MQFCGKCHEPLAPRDLDGATPEQQWTAKARFECPRCHLGGTSIIVMSDELQAQLDAMRRQGAQLDYQQGTL